MAFKSYEELTSMASTNPQRANALIAQAQKTGKPVVSSENSGYGKARIGALQRSMRSAKPVASSTPQDESIKNRKTGY